ncbi:MAG: DegT/DnrJ/EryC1/StrS family aminotransferase [Puniceicoccales bacterium]|jgi:dTDP-4-amino-4,6-dideoxygalactose transaminase|nr:DegT/DnrJ/EryC1/StrS family aminotransferase [Puniceicoccales bacterium]
MIRVPLLDLSVQNGEIETELTEAFRRVIRSCCYIMGPELEKLEKDTAALCAVKHAIGVSSGTDAILLALMALDLKEGDEVLVPAFTFFATAGCVVRAGLTPVFVDIDPHTFNISLEDAAAKVSPRTRAIIPVHLFGQAADMDALGRFANQHNLSIVEDCAQAIGAKWRGNPVGSFGNFGAFSFFPSKNLGGFGDSGLLVTNDTALAERARILRVHGMSPKYYHPFIGGNFRMDPLQSALISVKLPHLESYNRRRTANASFYRKTLGGLPHVADNTADAPDDAVLLLPVDFSGEGIWNQFTLRVIGTGQRDSLRAHLNANGIGNDIYYPLSLDQQECFKNTVRGGDKTIRAAHKLGGEVISIPVFPDLSQTQLETVTSVIAEWLEKL